MESDIRIRLFGKFSVHHRQQILLDHAPHKVQELLAYLILHRGKAHPRETLAELLWGEREASQTRKYLRQALWQLQIGLTAFGKARAARLLHVEPGWIELDPMGQASVDTLGLEKAFADTRGTTGQSMTPAQAQRLTDAVQLYGGELLEGWSQDWCAYERDRFRQMYLSILDKLADYCDARGEYEAGIAYGTLALQCDPARERTHRALMHLFARSGDRTAAIRQFERCCVALHDDLDVVPEDSTLSLYVEIRSGKLGPVESGLSTVPGATGLSRPGSRSGASGNGPLNLLKRPMSARR